jgi:ribosomal protein S17
MSRTKILATVLVVGSLAVGSGLALAATTESTVPEAAKTPAATQAAGAPAVEKAPKETKGTPQTTKGQVAQEKAEKAEKEVAPDRTVRGQVASVETASKTITVTVMRGKSAEIVGVEVPVTAKISAGKATKSLTDLKVGDQVRMTYDRLADKLVADQIHILKAAPKETKSESSKKSS